MDLTDGGRRAPAGRTSRRGPPTASVTDDAVLSSLLETLSTPTMRTRIWRGLKDEDTLETSRADHARIYDALARRDPELARTMAAAHVANVELWLRRNLAGEGT